MKTNKLSYVLFSLAIIAALFAAAIPMAPAHAMSASSTSTATTISSVADSSAPGVTVVICRHVVKWIHGHRISVRVCHRVPKPDTH